MNGSKRIFEEVLHHYGNRTTDFVFGILNNEKFVKSFERVLVASFEFRELVQKSVQAGLEQLNIPTREDVDRLLAFQQDLEDRLLALEEGQERIEAKLDALKKPARKPAAKDKGEKKP